MRQPNDKVRKHRIFNNPSKPMRKRTRSTFSLEFRLEAAQLVVDPKYTVRSVNYLIADRRSGLIIKLRTP
jgi:hypothetical protein